MSKRNIYGLVKPLLLSSVLILSLSNLVSAVDYDLIKDGYIDGKDLGAFVEKWLFDCSVDDCGGANFNNDNNNIDFADFALLVQYWLQVTDPNIVGWWRFDEDSGTTAHDLARGNDGTVNGAAWTSGQIGGALSFDGTDDYVSCPNNVSLNVPAGLTVGAWVYMNASGNYPALVTKGAGSSNWGYCFQFNAATRKINLFLENANESWTNCAQTLVPLSQWTYIAAVYDGVNTVRYYFNGTPDGSYVVTGGSILSNSANLLIGKRIDGFVFNGKIDDVRIYKRALSELEIRSLAGIGGYAWSPRPANMASGVATDTDLSWRAGAYAESHDVYFGTDFDDVNNADNSWPVATGPDDPNVYKGDQEPNSYDPCGLEMDTTYYWRIDEVNGTDIWKGQVWSFTTEALLAFPGAEGAGKWTVGGRGGTVIKVTNLNDSGTGSLRAAVNISGPRIVVFEVSGTITLLSRLNITSPYITIAGQTAPGDGICLKDYGVRVYTHDAIVRYIRCRPGDNVAFEPDSISVYHGDNVILDHVSASWSVDETLSVTYGDNVTVQWCIISESLNLSTHSEGAHGYASLINGEYGDKVTYHHNLYAHHKTRCPRPGGLHSYTVDPEGWTFDWRNNVIYSWLDTNPGYNSDVDKVAKMNFVGNYYKNRPGDDTTQIFLEKCIYAKAYLENNSLDNNNPTDQWTLWRWGSSFTEALKQAYKQSTPFDVAPVTTHDPSTAYTLVLNNAGATLPARDPVDTRIVNDVINGTGNIINDEDEVGGWPTLNSTTPLTDTDNDGMPNYWEIARGLNPNVNDSAGDDDGDGYTNIEEYINGIPW